MKYIKKFEKIDDSKRKITRNYKYGDIVIIIENNDIAKVSYKSGRTYIIYSLTDNKLVYDLPAGKFRKANEEEIDNYFTKKDTEKYNL